MKTAIYTLALFIGVVLTMGSGMLAGIVVELIRIHEIPEALRLFVITLLLYCAGGAMTVFIIVALIQKFGGRSQ